ncbi:serine hydrolase domain-containing protein [Tundrisphaera sp. TA3]|uniref:serine hydrolase domain-containing protein n=1 Tax=Tundrisphaera sp. TA3 TaxID=3435775 RepID=UPI003EBCCA91
MLRPLPDRDRSTSIVFVVLLLGFLLAFGRITPDPATLAGFDPDKLGRIDEALEEAVASEQIPGGVALVFSRGKEAYLAIAGYRDGSRRKPVERSTLFRIASMTKPITAAAALTLVDDGRIGLDDPVANYLPEFAAMQVLDGKPDAGDARVPADCPITVRHLLNHTAGFTYRFADHPVLGPLYAEFGISDGLAETPGTMEQNVRRLARLPLASQPGTAWTYSLSSDVLGRVIEVASGQRLDDFIRDRITGPLKMVDTHFVVPREKRGRLADLFTLGEDQKVRPHAPGLIQEGPLIFSGTFPTWDTGTYRSGGAGLTSTIDDYARFVRMLMNRGELDGVRILRPETVAAMTSDQCAPVLVPDWGHGDGYGFGLGVVTPANRFHNPAGVGTFGWAGFFHTFFWADPKNGLFGILLTNIQPSGHLTPLRETFKRTVYEARLR